MKHQYFGDVNDFYKYGLLHILCQEGELKLGVCWMLTPDDGRKDGYKIGYLDAPQKWRTYNPFLFDHLTSCVKGSRIRNLGQIESQGLPPGTQFYNESLPDSSHQRRLYLSKMRKKFAKADIIFLDPDNGLEVKSVLFGTRDSSKYLYWREVSEVYGIKHSVLIYQHFPRMKRTRFIADRAAMLSDITGAADVYSFRTSHVVFMLVAQKKHQAYFHRVAVRIQRMWGGRFEVSHFHSGR